MEQSKWWRKEVPKKYPHVCQSTDPTKANYAFLFMDSERTYSHDLVIPTPRTAQQYGTFSGSIGTSPFYGSYNATTIWQDYQHYPIEITEYSVALGIHRIVKDPRLAQFTLEGPNDSKMLLGMNRYLKVKVGQWRWSKPDKDVLVDAMKNLTEWLR